MSDGRAFVSGWIARCPDGIAGAEIRIQGLEATRTDVLVRRLRAPGGAVQSDRLTPDTPAFAPPPPRGAAAILLDYGRLGSEPFLEGVDHLLVLAALLLLVRRLRPLAAAITARTRGHSPSLAAATLGWLTVPPLRSRPRSRSPSRCWRRSRSVRPRPAADRAPSLGARRRFRSPPWPGLRGPPARDRPAARRRPLALLRFDLGVELGQLAFVAVVLTALRLLTRLGPLPAATPRLAAYVTGTLAAGRTIERLGAMLA